MPEGPQVVFLRELTSQFLNQPVLKAEGSAVGIPFDEVTGQVLTAVETFGKELLFCFPGFTLRVHLMLFGKYALNGELDRERVLGLAFPGGSINFYACRCGLLREPPARLYDWRTDVMHRSFDADAAVDKLAARPGSLVCEGLLDQRILAGVGNGIKNESLFLSRVHPQSLVGALPRAVLRGLVLTCVRFSFQYLRWKREGAGEPWQVYRQQACPRDHIPLRVEKLGKSGRSCYYCDKCQQLYLPDVF
jgi:endonuclease-8